MQAPYHGENRLNAAEMRFRKRREKRAGRIYRHPRPELSPGRIPFTNFEIPSRALRLKRAGSGLGLEGEDLLGERR